MRFTRPAALVLALAATSAWAAEPPSLGTTAVPTWSASGLFRSSLAGGFSSTDFLPMSPDIDFNTGRERALPGMSERDVFLKSFLTPRLNARLSGYRAAVDIDFADPNANPWTRSWETQDRVRDNTMRATKSAVKRYALERLYLAGWSLPLGSSHGRGVSAFRTESGGPRLRFGFSHRAPRVEALFPLDHGRIAVSADPLGRVGTAFETSSGRLRFGLNLDPQDKSATFGLLISL